MLNHYWRENWSGVVISFFKKVETDICDKPSLNELLSIDCLFKCQYSFVLVSVSESKSSLLISSSSEANSNASSDSPALAFMSRIPLFQKWPSTYFYCRLGRFDKPLKTFNHLFTPLRVIPKQRRVDVLNVIKS